MPASTARYTVGVDIGGTFTDVVVLAADGAITTAKSATTPDDFSSGVMDALEQAAATKELGEEMDEPMADQLIRRVQQSVDYRATPEAP
jgi:N-methylhydantoinase A/oxoprolinase/acetone carboxylase beta subunit